MQMLLPSPYILEIELPLRAKTTKLCVLCSHALRVQNIAEPITHGPLGKQASPGMAQHLGCICNHVHMHLLETTYMPCDKRKTIVGQTGHAPTCSFLIAS